MEMNKIGARIEQLRKSRGETQQELGDALGVKRETVYQWESGIRDIKTRVIIGLAKHFGVSSDYLLGLQEVKSADLKLQAVCKYTGLSEEVASRLNSMKILGGDPGKRIITTVNDIFEECPTLFLDIYDFLHSPYKKYLMPGKDGVYVCEHVYLCTGQEDTSEEPRYMALDIENAAEYCMLKIQKELYSMKENIESGEE